MDPSQRLLPLLERLAPRRWGPPAALGFAIVGALLDVKSALPAVLLAVLGLSMLGERTTQRDHPIWRWLAWSVAAGALLWLAASAFQMTGYPLPGALAGLLPSMPQLSAAFGLLACAVWPARRTRYTGALPAAMQALLWLVVLMASIDLLAHLSDMRYPFDAYLLFRMSPAVALGLLALAAGLLSLHADAREEEEHPGRVIVRRSTIALIAISSLVLIASYGRLEKLIVQSFTANYESALRARAQALEANLLRDAARVADVARRSSLERILWDLQATGQDSYNVKLASQRLSGSLHLGYTALRLQNAYREHVVTFGEFVRDPTFRVTLNMPHSAELIWHEGIYYVRSTAPVQGDGGEVYGWVVGELPLSWLADMQFEESAKAILGAQLICARLPRAVTCLPGRNDGSPIEIPATAASATSPVVAALGGTSGVQIARGVGGAVSVVAFRPVGTTGLGIATEVPTAVLFGPLRAQLLILLPLVALLIVAGVSIVGLQVYPLVGRLRSSQRALTASERTLRLIADNIPAMVAYVNAERRFVFANRGYERAYGVSQQVIVGAPVRDIVGDSAHEQSKPYIEEVLAGKRVHFERSVTGADGIRYELVDYVPDFDADGRVAGYFSLVHDITENKVAELRFKALAEMDALTGLPNRRHFEAHFEQAAALHHGNGGTMGLLFIDVDRFKQINDGLGHAIGDLALVEFGKRLKSAVRTDDFVARLGGDEFVVLLKGLASPLDAETVAAKIVAAMRPVLVTPQGPVQLSASIGVAVKTGAAIDPREMTEHADLAVYEAKQAGRGCFRVFGRNRPATAAVHLPG